VEVKVKIKVKAKALDKALREKLIPEALRYGTRCCCAKSAEPVKVTFGPWGCKTHKTGVKAAYRVFSVYYEI